MNKYKYGECVAVEGYVVTGLDGSNDVIGIVLESELVEMDQDKFEWLYTITTENGVDQYWPQEIKPVNSELYDYNTIHTPIGEINEK